MFTPYLFQRRPDERHTSSPLSPSSPDISYATSMKMSPRMYRYDHGLSLAPLALLEECQRLRRDPADEVILRSFDIQRT
jgi:hypothetical protein